MMRHLLLVLTFVAGARILWEPLFAQDQAADEKLPQKTDSASEYARMAEPELGVPPQIDLGKSVEIPLYVNGVRKFGNLGRSCDNYSLLGKDTVSGSVLQRHEGHTADGQSLPDVVWVSFGRNSTRDPAMVVGSVQMIGCSAREVINGL